MKKLLLLIIPFLFIGCKSSQIVLYNGNEKIYEGYGKAIPDFESPTFNIKVKEKDGDTILFFGNSLKGSVCTE